MSEFGYRPSIEEIKRHAEASDAASKAKRAERQDKEQKNKSKLKAAAGLAAATVLAAAAVKSGAVKAGGGTQELSNDRFTPERASTAYTGTMDESRLTPEQQKTKEMADAAIRADEKRQADKALESNVATPPAPDATGEQTEGFR